MKGIIRITEVVAQMDFAKMVVGHPHKNVISDQIVVIVDQEVYVKLQGILNQLQCAQILMKRGQNLNEFILYAQ